METLESVKRSIDTARDLRSIVKTMKALAAVNIRQFERAVESLADYNRTIELGLQVVLRNQPRVGVTFRAAPQRRLGVVVFGSDQGMCGQLNDQIVDHAIHEIARAVPGEGGAAILAVGMRAAGRLEDAGYGVEEAFPVPGSTSGITPKVQDLVLRIRDWNEQREIDRIHLYYSEHQSRGSYQPHTTHLLPMDRAWLERLEQRAWPTHMLPAYTMQADRLFSALVRQYLFVSLYRAFAESLASENASRLASMRNAERSIGDRITELTSLYHRQRQTSITEELLDIASGFEALTSEEHPSGPGG